MDLNDKSDLGDFGGNSLIFIKLLSIIQTYKGVPLAKMQALPAKDSLYSIEPWNDEPTALPHSFLASHKFAKTGFFPSAGLRSAQNLQLATNSVYLIKNEQEEERSVSRKRLRYHCTAQNSPRMAAHNEQKSSIKRGLSERLTKSHQMMKNCKKKQLDDDFIHPKFQETKQTFIEFKFIKRSRRASQEYTDPKNAESKSNLQKKYQKSTFVRSSSKKDGKLQEGLEEICIRHKLKTQKSKVDSIKNLLNYTEDPQKMLQQNQSKQPLKLNPQQSSKESQGSKSDLGGQKLKFQLMMQRKLFLMKTNLGKWHKNIENYSIGANRKSK